jgi:hypothetical protein
MQNNYFYISVLTECHISVGVAMSCGLDAQKIGVRFPAWGRDFSLFQSILTGFEVHHSSV